MILRRTLKDERCLRSNLAGTDYQKSGFAYAAEKRMGTPEELGFAIATVADERNGYLAGVDVACQSQQISDTFKNYNYYVT